MVAWVAGPRSVSDGDFHHVEVGLGHAAIRAGPVGRDVSPACAGGYALIGQALFLVVDEAADDALPGFEFVVLFTW